MQRYLIFDETTKQLKGFLEVPTSAEAENMSAINGTLIPVDAFPVLAEGTTLQLNSDGTWGEVTLPDIVMPVVEKEV